MHTHYCTLSYSEFDAVVLGDSSTQETEAGGWQLQGQSDYTVRQAYHEVKQESRCWQDPRHSSRWPPDTKEFSHKGVAAVSKVVQWSKEQRDKGLLRGWEPDEVASVTPVGGLRLTWVPLPVATPQSGINPSLPPATLEVWLKCCQCCDLWPPCEHRQDKMMAPGVSQPGSDPSAITPWIKLDTLQACCPSIGLQGSEDDTQLTSTKLNRTC